MAATKREAVLDFFNTGYDEYHVDYRENSITESYDFIIRAPEFLQPFFRPFFETTLPCADFNRFFLKTKNRDDDFPVDLSSSAKQVVNPAHGCPIVANWYDEISIISGIRAPWSH